MMAEQRGQTGQASLSAMSDWRRDYISVAFSAGPGRSRFTTCYLIIRCFLHNKDIGFQVSNVLNYIIVYPDSTEQNGDSSYISIN